MKKTFKHYLTESRKLPHWPKTKDELIAAYQKVMIDQETGEVMMEPYDDDEHPTSHKVGKTDRVVFNDDLTVSIKTPQNAYKDHRVQIHNWMLVDGHLPFPFKEVSVGFSIEKACNLKSLAGVPKKCESFNVWQRGLDNTVTDFVGGPDVVEESFTVRLNDGIKSTAGLPKSVPKRLELICDNLEDFSHLPKDTAELVLGRTPHFTEEHFKFLPPHSSLIAFSNLKGLHSFHNLHKYVKSTKKIGLYEVKITSSILSLSMISDLAEVDEYFYDVNADDKDWPTDGIIQIVNKYIGTHDVFEFQEELANAGYHELAKL